MRLKEVDHNKTKDPINKLIDEKINEIINDLDEQKTNALLKALDDNGKRNIKLESIIDRCEFVSYPDSRQIFRLDGKDLLEFLPVESEEIKKDGKTVIIFKQKMRKLY